MRTSTDSVKETAESSIISSRATSEQGGASPAYPVERRAVPRVTVVQLLLKYLKSEGNNYIFGIPGGPLMPLYEALCEGQEIKPILAKHEQGAAFMADGYARLSKRLAACCVT